MATEPAVPKAIEFSQAFCMACELCTAYLQACFHKRGCFPNPHTAAVRKSRGQGWLGQWWGEDTLKLEKRWSHTHGWKGRAPDHPPCAETPRMNGKRVRLFNSWRRTTQALGHTGLEWIPSWGSHWAGAAGPGGGAAGQERTVWGLEPLDLGGGGAARSAGRSREPSTPLHPIYSTQSPPLPAPEFGYTTVPSSQV